MSEKDKWWIDYYTCLCIGEYKKPFKGEVDEEDKDPVMKHSARWYKIEDAIKDPSFKEA